MYEKRGVGMLGNQNFTKAFFKVWKLKGVEFAKQLIKLKFNFINPFAFKKFLFVFVTHNQYLAIAPIFEKFRGDSTGIKHEFNVNQKLGNSSNLPFLYIFFLDFISFPVFYLLHRKFLISTYGSHIKDITLINLSSFTLSIYRIFAFLFWIKKPQYLIMANDHSDINVGAFHAAKRNQITTIYFQHANVSDIFPPMTFDYAFLYSEMAAEVYSNIKQTNTSMISVGNMKADGFIQINQERVFDRNNLRIVLCVNTVAEIETYVSLAKKLADLDNVKLIKFRLHPYLLKFQMDFDHPKIIISNSKLENSFECFKDMDLNIAGNSSIIEEALFTDTPTVYFDLDEKMSDYYGYAKNQIVITTLKNIDAVIGFIKNYDSPISVISKAVIYSSSINTKFTGKTSELVGKIIMDIDSGKFPDPEVLEKDNAESSENIYRIVGTDVNLPISG
ncbi:hypothetical protein [Mongoliibacter ruber]|nr:hypothetical protein [Mongoliibacter ruber]